MNPVLHDVSTMVANYARGLLRSDSGRPAHRRTMATDKALAEALTEANETGLFAEAGVTVCSCSLPLCLTDGHEHVHVDENYVLMANCRREDVAGGPEHDPCWSGLHIGPEWLVTKKSR